MIRETEDNLHLMLIKVLYKTLKCKVSFLEVIKSPGRPHSSAFSLLSGIMATGPDAIELWLLPSGVVSFFILLLILSIFLTGLCSDCGRSAVFLHHRMMKWMKMKSLTWLSESILNNPVTSEMISESLKPDLTLLFVVFQTFVWASGSGGEQNPVNAHQRGKRRV